MEEKIKNNKRLIVAIITVIVFILTISGYICYKKILNNNKGDNNIINNNTKIDDSNFDFNELSSTLHSSIQNENLTTFISMCDSNTPNEGESINIKIRNITVSNATIDSVINKLKTAKSVDKEITYSWFGCPYKSITYYISNRSDNQNQVDKQKIFSLNYANDNESLLIEYNKKGYAFHYNSNEEIKNFIESLK